LHKILCTYMSNSLGRYLFFPHLFITSGANFVVSEIVVLHNRKFSVRIG
jgi:hypothetical protein